MPQAWERIISAPGLNTAKYAHEGGTRHLRLVAEPIQHKILQNVELNTFGFNGTTPGPLIIVYEGDWVNLTVENRTNEPTALHVHGLSKPNSEDGVPEIEPTPLIKPGESYTYRFLAWQNGTFFYHSTQKLQSNFGLVGPFIVLPRTPWQMPDRDYVLHLQQWEIPQPELGRVNPGTYHPSRFQRNPNFFTINGRAFPFTMPLYTRMGERVRLRFVQRSNNSHTMHLHGHDFKVVAIDAFTQPESFRDTINIAPGTRWDVELSANNPGAWPLVGTKPFHTSNNGETPGGMMTRFIYQ